MRYGAWSMFSMPPATATLILPREISWAAETMACAPEPQTRLTVSAGVVTGSPAWTAACRAGFILVPAWTTLPMTTVSTSSGRMFARVTAAVIATEPRVGAGTSLSEPPKVPNAVRTGSAKTTERCDVMANLLRVRSIAPLCAYGSSPGHRPHGMLDSMESIQYCMEQRLGPMDWIDAGLRALARSGFTALKADMLAKSLGVSRGSFYCHFADGGAFQPGVRKRWREVAVKNIVGEIEGTGGDRLQALLRRGFSARLTLESAVRAWGFADQKVRTAVDTVDAERV